MKSVLIVIAKKNFRDEEFLEPKKVFIDEKFEVAIASTEPGKCVGKLGTIVNADVSIYDVDEKDYDAIVFVGGLGSLVYENDEKVHDLIKNFIKSGKIVASICISPRILIKAGVLKDKRFTMWNSDGSQDIFIKKSGGVYTGENVTVDEKIITANGPHSAHKFGKEISNLLKII